MLFFPRGLPRRGDVPLRGLECRAAGPLSDRGDFGLPTSARSVTSVPRPAFRARDAEAEDKFLDPRGEPLFNRPFSDIFSELKRPIGRSSDEGKVVRTTANTTIIWELSNKERRLQLPQ